MENIDTACDFVKANDSDSLQNVIMCHLSSENADKDSFIAKMKNAVNGANVDVAEQGKSWILRKGDEPPFVKEYHDYYRTLRDFHERSLNSTGAWNATNALSFMNMPILTYIKEISPRPLLIIVGENAHSRYFSEDAYKLASEPKELVIIPNAVHVDLYDKLDKIPFGKLETFFKEHLK